MSPHSFKDTLKSALKPLTSAVVVLGALSALAPSSASACGGLFCNPNQPVNQAAERILFAQDPTEPELMQMHVRLLYQGNAEDFSWLLPVPPNTRFEISREQVFTRLDANFAPMFTLNRVTEEECDFDARSPSVDDFAEAGAQGGTSAQEPSVTVTSREEVGPYDKVTLAANDVDVLLEWLETNGFDQPDGTREVLEPYLEDYEFLAIKLRTDDSASVVPVMLTFPGDTPAIPMRPTSVAANPDMGVIVHVLGETRAVPVNGFAHVEINDTAIDWLNQGRNYSDVVSQAVDEAPNGLAFTTDFAGTHGLGNVVGEEFPRDLREELESVTNLQQLSEVIFNLANWGFLGDRDFSVFFRQALVDVGLDEETISEMLNISVFCEFGDCWADEEPTMNIMWAETPFDGMMLVSEVNAFYEHNAHINDTFEAHPYLSRLYTTLSADEMTADPSFAFNPDLGDVARTRTATLYQTCEGTPIRLVTPSNLEVNMRDGEPEVIERQEGETVRGQSLRGSAVVERTMSVGQSEVIEDNRPELEDTFAPLYDGGEESSLLGCEQSSEAPTLLSLLLSTLALMVGVRRRKHA
jgi:hypothetical protein